MLGGRSPRAIARVAPPSALPPPSPNPNPLGLPSSAEEVEAAAVRAAVLQRAAYGRAPQESSASPVDRVLACLLGLTAQGVTGDSSVRATFRRLDADGDGLLTLREAARGLASLGVALSLAETGQLVRELGPPVARLAVVKRSTVLAHGLDEALLSQPAGGAGSGMTAAQMAEEAERSPWRGVLDYRALWTRVQRYASAYVGGAARVAGGLPNSKRRGRRHGDAAIERRAPLQ